MKFEIKIAAFLDTYSPFDLDTGTKQLIGCKWVMGTLDWLLIIDDKHANNTMHIDRIILGHGKSCNVTLSSSKLASAEKKWHNRLKKLTTLL